MKTLIKYWLIWKLYSLFLPEYAYAWYRSAFRVKVAELKINTETRRIKAKYKLIFIISNMDYYQYLQLKELEQKEIDSIINN